MTFSFAADGTEFHIESAMIGGIFFENNRLRIAHLSHVCRKVTRTSLTQLHKKFSWHACHPRNLP
jgi:hypothetical protein